MEHTVTLERQDHSFMKWSPKGQSALYRSQITSFNGYFVFPTVFLSILHWVHLPVLTMGDLVVNGTVYTRTSKICHFDLGQLLVC